jgi:peroxiredoxin Q/BCP
MALHVGDTIPDFSLKDQFGNMVKIKDLLSQEKLVLYFYPKDETPGCTKQACSFRDHYQAFMDAGARVIGISSDNEKSHGDFATHHKLPFILLSDIDGEIMKAFGVKSDFLGLIPGRSTYIIDKHGIIRYKFNSQLNIEKHIIESLRFLKVME